jgi:hypothetical protein
MEEETIADLFGICQRWWILIGCDKFCQKQFGATDFGRVIQKFAGAFPQKFSAPGQTRRRRMFDRFPTLRVCGRHTASRQWTRPPRCTRIHRRIAA